MAGRLPAACLAGQRPVAVARDVAAGGGAQVPRVGPGPGPAGQLPPAKQRQKNMHLSPNTKKRHAAAHGYANQLAARSSRSSLITALIGAVAVQAGIPPLDRMRAVCCKGTCFNKKDCPGAACIMAVGGYSHLEQIHAEHLGTEPDLKPRQKKHKGTFGGYVKARGPVAARKERLQVHLDDVVNCEQLAAAPGQKHDYRYTYTLPHPSGRGVPVCKHFFAAVLGYKPDHSQWRACMRQAEDNALAARAVALGLGPAPPAPTRTTGFSSYDGHRARMTLDWFAQFVQNYAEPMPMRLELRFHFAHAAGLYFWLRSELELQLGQGEAARRLVGQRRFEQLLASPDLLQQPAVKAAIEAKLAFQSRHNLDVTGYSLSRRDPVFASTKVHVPVLK